MQKTKLGFYLPPSPCALTDLIYAMSFQLHPHATKPKRKMKNRTKKFIFHSSSLGCKKIFLRIYGSKIQNLPQNCS